MGATGINKGSRRLTARIGAAAGVIFLLCVLDLILSGHMQNKNMVRVAVGTSQPVSGDLATPVQSAAELRYKVDTSEIEVRIVEGRGRFWRGVVKVPLETSPGDYRLQVYSTAEREPDKVPYFLIVVMDSAWSVRAADRSVVRRLFNIHPLWAAGASFLLLIAALLCSFLLSSRHEAGLAVKGIAPIIKMARRNEAWEITICAVRGFGARQGDCLPVLDSDFRNVSEMVVDTVQKGLIRGHSNLGQISPDSYVQLAAARRGKADRQGDN